MNAEEKRRLVEKLVDLTVRNPVRKHPAGADGLVKEINEKIRQRMREQQIDIRLKHFSPEQLAALLNFYGTDIGKSIIASQGRISDEFASAMQLVTREVIEVTQEKGREEAFKKMQEKRESEAKPNRIDSPKPGWVLVTGTQMQDTSKNLGAIPNCSFCNEKPLNLREVVAGPNLFICRKCVIHACESLRDAGFPIEGND